MDKTQISKVLAYCKQHGSITVRDAAVKLEINSPTKTISNMRLSGLYDVRSVTETRTKDNGETVRYKRYFIAARGEA